MTEWRERAAELTDLLEGSGVLGDGWRDPFASTPRHLFVLAFYDADGELVSGEDPETRQRWWDGVYADESLTTQRAPMPGGELLIPTSSSTRPSLMAHMLDILQVSDGHRVLEIGTGTGYNAALLCRRLGAGNVASIDIDPQLVRVAAERLAHLGYRPHLAPRNALVGHPDRAPYDRIIATCAVSGIPSQWVGQLAEDGIVVADVRGELASALVVAHKTEPHTVIGRFLPTPGHFMWLRPHADSPLRRPPSRDPFDFTDPTTATTVMPLHDLDSADFGFLLQLVVPALGPVGRTVRDGTEGRFLFTEDDHSWAEVHPDGTVRYGGPYPLWPTVADTWRRWNQYERPGPRRYGLTAHDSGEHAVWLDEPREVVSATAAAG
ncbi:MAG: methyltransferase domain-containing protein [Actinocatenispora sp.]